MRNKITVYEPNIIDNQKIRSLIKVGEPSHNLIKNDPVSEIMISEGHEDFYSYIKGLGLAKDRNLVFLSSVHHYYYDAEEMKSVKTVINLKELNQVKHIKSFLHSIYNILPHKCNFIGCFVDNKKNNGFELRNNSSSSNNKINFDSIENGVVSENPFLNMLYSIIDLKTNKYMSENSVSLLLKDYGFRVLDIKEINGLTYFHAKKVRSADN